MGRVIRPVLEAPRGAVEVLLLLDVRDLAAQAVSGAVDEALLQKLVERCCG
jgi:hypothetical protein